MVKTDRDLADSNNNRYILKMQGSLDNLDSIVLKESDYITYEQKHILIETFIKSILIDHTFLFAGYAFNDYNLKLILGWINYFTKRGEGNQGFSDRVARPRSFIILNKEPEPYLVKYFENYNISIVNAGALPENILNKHESVNLEEQGKNLYAFLHCIQDQSDDLLLEPLEDFLYDRYQVFDQYNRIAVSDLNRHYHFGAIENGCLSISFEKYPKLEKILNAGNKKAGFIKNILNKAGITSIKNPKYFINNQHIAIDPGPKKQVHEQLLTLFLENQYAELMFKLEKLDNLPAKTYYDYLIKAKPDQNKMDALDHRLQKTAGAENASILQLIIHKYNQSGTETARREKADEFDQIMKNLPETMKKACQYIVDMKNGLIAETNRLYQLLDKQKAFNSATPRIPADQIDVQYGYLPEIQSIVYNYYFFMRYNYLMEDYSLTAQNIYQLYAEAILCTYSGGYEPYLLNDWDLDILVKCTNPLKLIHVLQQYRVVDLNYRLKSGVADKFKAFCESIAVFHNKNTQRQLHSFSAILAASTVNGNEQVEIIDAFHQLLREFCKPEQMLNFINLFDAAEIIITAFYEPDQLVFSDMLSMFLAGETLDVVQREFKIQSSHQKILDVLAPCANEKHREQIDQYLESCLDIPKKCDWIYRCSKLLSVGQKEKYGSYLQGNIENLPKRPMAYLLQGLLPYSDAILEQNIKDIDHIIEDRKKGVFRQSFDPEVLIEDGIILFLNRYINDLSALEPYRAYSACLDFLLAPDDFDYKKVDLNSSLWQSLFWHKEYGQQLKRRKKDYLTPAWEKAWQNRILSPDQEKIIFGFLLDEREVQSFGKQ